MRTPALITANVEALLQARSVLEGLDDNMYARIAPGTNSIRIGGHVRHVVEFYECFLRGADRGVIDYEARERNAAVENDRRRAVQRLHELLQELQRLPAVRTELPLQVYAEDSGLLLASTSGRELHSLVSHTIHHFAMIAVAIHAWKVAVDPAFGVAAATLRYRARIEEAA